MKGKERDYLDECCFGTRSVLRSSRRVLSRAETEGTVRSQVRAVTSVSVTVTGLLALFTLTGVFLYGSRVVHFQPILLALSPHHKHN